LLERLTVNAEVLTAPGSIPATSDTVESEKRQIKQCCIQYIEEKKSKKSPCLKIFLTLLSANKKKFLTLVCLQKKFPTLLFANKKIPDTFVC
jgi:hypothetical protein